jgi:hypothetical protein
MCPQTCEQEVAKAQNTNLSRHSVRPGTLGSTLLNLMSRIYCLPLLHLSNSFGSPHLHFTAQSQALNATHQKLRDVSRYHCFAASARS